jgi:hypothetical protein
MANLLPPPGQPMVNPLPQPAPTLLAPVRHSTYSSFYSDPMLDPFQGSYARVMERMDPEVNNALSHVMLLEQAVGVGPVPQAYLCCSVRRNQVRVFCLHLPSRYVSSLDGNLTPWDGQIFAFLGEITQGMITTVELPANAFRTVNNVRAKTCEYIISHLDEIEQAGLEPVLADEPTSNRISTRQIMYLPPRYVQLMLNPSGYSLRQMWDILYPAILANQDEIPCGALLKWMRAVTMGTPVQGNIVEFGPTTAALNLSVPLADQDLLAHRQRLQRQALTGLHQPAETLELALTQMAAAVTHNTNENRLAREEKAARAAEPKLPSDKFTITLNILQEYLEIPNENDLPPLWHRWANGTKKQEFTILSDQLGAYARGAEAFITTMPVVNVHLVQDLLSFTFVGDTLDDIKTGIQPFVIADGSAEHRQANLELSRLYGLLNSGEQALMLSDLETLKAKEVQATPLTYFELERNLGMFGNLLGVVLGSQHILTTTYRAFWNLLSQGYRNEIQTIIDQKGFIKPTHILRSIQLVCYNWFSQKRARLTPAQPNFINILHTVTMQTYILPHLPPVLYRLAYPKPQAYLPPAPDLISLSGTSHSSASGTGTSSSSNSVVSALTNPSLMVPQDASNASRHSRKGSYMANLKPDPALQQLIPSDIKIKDIIGSTTPPQLDNGAQLCLSFHTKQGCWSTCRRANTHGVTLNAAEKTRVIAYLRSRVPQQRPAPGATAGDNLAGSS